MLRALLDFDHGAFTLIADHQISVFWEHPADREKPRPFDEPMIRKLISAGYISVRRDGQLWPTERGFTIILAYRPNYWRQPAVYPNYTNWLSRCNTFKRYLKLYGEG